MFSITKSHLAFILALLSAGTASIAVPASPVSIAVVPLETAPAFGDSMSFVCTVTAPEDAQLSDIKIADSGGRLDIENNWSIAVKNPDGTVSRSYGFLTYVMSPDTLSFGPVILQYVTADGDSGTAVADAVTLPVKSLIQNPEKPDPLRPSRNPFKISARGLPLWLWLLIAAALILATYLLVRHFRKSTGTLQAAVSDKPIDELEEFEKIRGMKLPDQGRIKEHYFLVSNAMRAFLHRKMAFDALYETSYEILLRLSTKDIDDETFSRIRDLFNEADMVKFAKHVPSAEETTSFIDRSLLPVRSILDMLKREEERMKALAEKELTQVENTPRTPEAESEA